MKNNCYNYKHTRSLLVYLNHCLPTKIEIIYELNSFVKVTRFKRNTVM